MSSTNRAERGVPARVTVNGIPYVEHSKFRAAIAERDRFKAALDLIVGMLAPSPSRDAQMGVAEARKALCDD